jgi:hypothetical protein
LNARDRVIFPHGFTGSPLSERRHTVFIAYARTDAPTVRVIAERLRSRGIETRIDTEDIPPGSVWVETLQDFIRNADTILFILSPASMRSQWCQREVEFAVQFNKRILPVLVESVPDDIIPPQLARLQYLVLTNIDDERAFGSLVDAIYAGAKYGQGAQGNNVFLSYRRAEDAHVAGRIYDHLEGEFGTKQVFFDVEGIPIGADFRESIRAALLRSQALVVVIGRRWAARFHQSSWVFWRPPNIDYVKIEIEFALDHSVRIIPVLVDDAEMPQEHQIPAKIAQICYFNAASLRAGLGFRDDIKKVLEAIKDPPRHATI